MRRRFAPHQLAAFKYALRETHPALFMEMRLRKTSICIRRCQLYGRGGKFLVIAPGSALGSWTDELRLEGVADRDVVIISGTKAQRKKLLRGPGVWYLIHTEGHRSVPEISRPGWRWTGVIIDESTSIRNPRAQVTEFCLQNFRDVEHRWILTGTPNPESDMEFFCQMAFLDGQFLGFRNWYQMQHNMYHPHWSGERRPNADTSRRIAQAVRKRAFVLSRATAGFPDRKVVDLRWLELPDALRTTYARAEKGFVLEWEGRQTASTIWATGVYLWLRRLCGGFLVEQEPAMTNPAGDDPCLDGEEGDTILVTHLRQIWAGKVDELVRLLTTELARKQVVVWFCFNAELSAAEQSLKSAKVKCASLTGQIPREAREQLRQRFMAGDIRVLLVQEKVAALGMNLSCADTAIYFSEPPGLLSSKQTEDRILQLDKVNPLLLIYLLVKNSVDQDIHEALRMKAIRSRQGLGQELLRRLLRRNHARQSN